MIAKLWADKIIAGEKTFQQVPAKLKAQVRQVLIERGREDLAVE